MAKRMQANKNPARVKAVRPAETPAAAEMSASDSLSALLKALINHPRKGPLKIEIVRLPEQADASDGGPETGNVHLHTDGEVSGRNYARDLGQVAEAADRVLSMTFPKVGEVPGLVDELRMALEQLDKDVTILEEKLAPALASSLLDQGPTNTASGATEPVPHSILGRSLKDAIARVQSVRLHMQDLTVRTAL